jgi:hypothetical protein
MRTALLILLAASSAVAQDQAAGARVAPSCGPNDVNFEVKTEKKPHQAGQPDAGKALLYFVEDDTRFESMAKPTVRAGLDGQWVGATHGNSWFHVSVEPGEHHLCASWQSYSSLPDVFDPLHVAQAGSKTAAVHFRAQAGGVYYFRVKDIVRRDDPRRAPSIELEPLDSDEGQVLANTYSLSTFRQK